ncbi:hypothetical protein [Virgibacillus sp. Bac330]|uniref:hypothetical protein n=1 Tax=Virgibacillus sp. Bac330 TaxID=2419841 RepID=UPI000EF499A3|nr:hypothetical protein [Virgibacillus sp. Bac330]
MATIANFTFNNHGTSVDFHEQEAFPHWKKYEPDPLTREEFLEEVAPGFISMGASVVTVLHDHEKGFYSYEVQLNNIHELLKNGDVV